MAKFTDLSNELVLAIASFIRKPADIFHLCIAERRSYELVQPLLYENIVFNHIDYPTHNQARKIRSNIRLLCRCIQIKWRANSRRVNDGPTSGGECRSLAINIDERLAYDEIGICAFVPFLTSFSLISSPRHEGISPRPETKIEIDQVGRALQPLRHTLETLTLYIHNQSDCWSRGGIGSLHDFKAMKKLRVQSQVLLGHDGVLRKAPKPLLSQILPPNLEDLTIHCCEYGLEHTDKKIDVAHHVEEPLDGKPFSTRTFEPDERLKGTDRRMIESVVVCWLGVSLGSILTHPPFKLKESFDIIGRKVN